MAVLTEHLIHKGVYSEVRQGLGCAGDGDQEDLQIRDGGSSGEPDGALGIHWVVRGFQGREGVVLLIGQKPSGLFRYISGNTRRIGEANRHGRARREMQSRSNARSTQQLQGSAALHSSAEFEGSVQRRFQCAFGRPRVCSGAHLADVAA
jgi:hypothetical protein